MIADLEAGVCADSSLPASVSLGGRMSDIQLDEVPLSELRTPRRTAEVVAGPGASPTVHVRTASCKVTILDRTKWPIKGVTVEVWSQILGFTNGEGLYDSPLFYAGDYPLKVRAPFVGLPAGGAENAVLPMEVTQDGQFLDGASTLSVQVGLSASGLSAYDRATQIFWRAIPKAPGELREQLKGMISPLSIGIMVTLAGLWVASHFVGVGEVADVLLALTAAIRLGLTLALAKMLATDILLFLTAILVGKNEFELDEAASALARIVINLGTILFMKVAEDAIKKGVRNSYRPKGIADEVTKEPPRSPNVNEALQSKLGKRLASIVGDTTLEDRLKAAEACAKADPTLTQIPAEDLASGRGYTSHQVTELGRAAGKPDYSILNKILRDGNSAAVAKSVEYIDSILRALNRLPKFRARTVRGLPIDNMPGFADKLKPGHLFRDKAFFSTSVDETAAMDYLLGKDPPNLKLPPGTPPPAPRAPPKKGLFFHVQGYSGRRVQSFTEVTTDNEALFRPGTIFMVLKKWVTVDAKTGTEITHVSMVEVEESVSQFASTWGTAGALVANIKALRIWAEKNPKQAEALAAGAH